MCRRFVQCAFMLLIVGLVGCAGTIERDSKAGSRKIQGGTYRSVEVVLTDSARKLQAENVQFSVRELSDYVRRRLESSDLLRGDGEYRVEIAIENFRVRSAAAAVLFGIMAGTDSIDGYVKVFDPKGRPVHAYKVSASYGLGGWGGGQDGMRMNWLYDKFSELTVAELADSTDTANLAKARTARAASPSSSIVIAPSANDLQRSSPTAVARTSSETSKKSVATQPEWTPNAELRNMHPATNFAKLNDVDAVPGISATCRERYRNWFSWDNPKAYAIGQKGHCGFSSGTRPPSKDLPIDPAERALAACARAGNVDCKLYAIDDTVVWKP